MLNRGKFYEINKIVRDFKKEADNILKRYRVELAELEQKKDRFRPDYLKSLEEEIDRRYTKLLNLEKQIAVNKMQPIFEGIEADAMEWTQEAPKMDFIQRIELIKSAGLKIGHDEAEMLRKSASGNYLAERAFFQYVAEKGSEELNHFTYMKIKEPTLEGLLQDISRLKSRAEASINYYCGRGEEQEIKLIEKKDVVTFSLIARSEKEITPELNEISKKWAEFMVKSGENITEDEKEWLKSGIGSASGYNAKEKANEFIKQYPGSEEIIALSEEYNKLMS